MAMTSEALSGPSERALAEQNLPDAAEENESNILVPSLKRKSL